MQYNWLLYYMVFIIQYILHLVSKPFVIFCEQLVFVYSHSNYWIFCTLLPNALSVIFLIGYYFVVLHVVLVNFLAWSLVIIPVDVFRVCFFLFKAMLPNERLVEKFKLMQRCCWFVYFSKLFIIILLLNI